MYKTGVLYYFYNYSTHQGLGVLSRLAPFSQWRGIKRLGGDANSDPLASMRLGLSLHTEVKTRQPFERMEASPEKLGHHRPLR